MNSLLQQRLRQFLVHSYLYYKLDESIISDTEYDRICMELRELLKKHPEADLPFRKIAEKALGDEASGYSIRQYLRPSSVHRCICSIRIIIGSKCPLLIFWNVSGPGSQRKVMVEDLMTESSLTDLSQIGYRIRSEREKNGWSISEVSAYLRINEKS